MKLLSALFILFVTTQLHAQELNIKSDDVKISFIADMQKTSGTIGGFQAKIKFDPSNLSQASISGSVNVSTLNTGNEKRDEHLKSEDYFHVAKYPKMYFSSSSFTEVNGKIVMTGKLKIKGTTREEKITFTYENNVFIGTLKIKATNYEMGNFSDKKPEKTDIIIQFSIPIAS